METLLAATLVVEVVIPESIAPNDCNPMDLR